MKCGKRIVNDILGKDREIYYPDTQSLVKALKLKYPKDTLQQLAFKVNVVGKYGTMENQSRRLTVKDVKDYLTKSYYEHDKVL